MKQRDAPSVVILQLPFKWEVWISLLEGTAATVETCSLHAQQMMLNFSPEPNLLRVLMYWMMYAALNAVAHSNANGLPFKRQRVQWFYWNSPKCFISKLLMEWCRFMGSIFNLTSLVDSDQWVSFGILQSWKGCKKIVSLEYTMALEGTAQTSEQQTPIIITLWIFPKWTQATWHFKRPYVAQVNIFLK